MKHLEILEKKVKKLKKWEEMMLGLGGITLILVIILDISKIKAILMTFF